MPFGYTEEKNNILNYQAQVHVEWLSRIESMQIKMLNYLKNAKYRRYFVQIRFFSSITQYLGICLWILLVDNEMLGDIYPFTTMVIIFDCISCIRWKLRTCFAGMDVNRSFRKKNPIFECSVIIKCLKHIK